MKRAATSLALFLAAGVAGWLAAEALCRVPPVRDLIGRTFGRGALVALTNGIGIYQADLDDSESQDSQALVVEENLQRAASAEVVQDADVAREVDLLRFQFADQPAFEDVVRGSGLNAHSLRERVARNLRERQWLETQIAPRLKPGDGESESFFKSHPELCEQPTRYHARHLFMAAHAATPPDVVETKKAAMAALSARLAKAEDFAQLAAENSEDEATKLLGGDLGWFSSSRLPEEFVREIAKLKVGQVSAPFRSHLGFHIVQLVDVQPAREMKFDEVRGEIDGLVANRKRSEAVLALTARLSPAEFLAQ